jgi:hypothetical protein
MLTEWRDAGAPAIEVAAAISSLIDAKIAERLSADDDSIASIAALLLWNASS